MKRFLVVLSLVMLLTEDFPVSSSYDTFYGSNNMIAPDCTLYENPGCPRNLDPVCGTDSVTYANECELCEKNREQSQNIQIKWKGPC